MYENVLFLRYYHWLINIIMTSSYRQTSYPRHPFISLTNQNEAFLKTRHPLTNESRICLIYILFKSAPQKGTEKLALILLMPL